MRLLKSLYGLPNSLLNWWQIGNPFLIEIGFELLKSDTFICVYTTTIAPPTFSPFM